MRFSLRFIRGSLRFYSSTSFNSISGRRPRRSGYGLKRGQNFLPTILKPRRQMKLGAQVAGVFVFFKSSGHIATTLDQYTAWRTNIHGVKIEAIFYLRCVRIAQLLVDRLLSGEGRIASSQ